MLASDDLSCAYIKDGTNLKLSYDPWSELAFTIVAYCLPSEDGRIHWQAVAAHRAGRGRHVDAVRGAQSRHPQTTHRRYHDVLGDADRGSREQATDYGSTLTTPRNSRRRYWHRWTGLSSPILTRILPADDACTGITSGEATAAFAYAGQRY
ncbi:hypothetical protein BD410DRAFT_809110 [Rickenella mellea]|uniref:Uncharacterized protein n=1 Tax=Rickenella mellea TaxID=50990 RepID=A0A4Y7PL95_9AGAM|nr:hypothetical protein BD410DRAFT_809110 [Rickenella mellea]